MGSVEGESHDDDMDLISESDREKEKAAEEMERLMIERGQANWLKEQ
jgi:hypothetical protein